MGYHVRVLSPRTVRALLLLLAFASSLTLRTAFSHRNVFRGDDVVFQDPDAAFHVRTIQNLVHHFPHRTGLAPYSGFPRGQNVDTGPFHDYTIGTLAWIAGFGAPSRHLTDVVAACFPALLGALIVIPVYLLGRALFTHTAALIAAGLIAILPGFFLWITRLGNPDHHVTEVFLGTLLVLLLVKALQANSPWRLAALAGLVLGCYLATQSAGVFLLLFLPIWAILQIGSNHLQGASSRPVWAAAVPPLFIGWLIVFLTGPTLWSNVTTFVLFGSIVSITVAVALSEALPARLPFFIALPAVAITGAAAIAWLQPQLAEAALASVTGRFSGPAQTVGELRPLFTFTGSFSFAPAWAEFTTCWFLAPIALLYTGWRACKTNSPAHLLFAVWSAFMLAASIQMIRNCFYLAVPMALLTGFAAAHLLQHDRRYERIGAGLLVAAALLVPNLALAYPFVTNDTGPRQDWLNAFTFLRTQTPEPFNDAAAYDRYFPRRAEEATFAYPPSAYGVLNWWDFGHWISAYGRRIPIANGMQTGATEAARFFTATDPASAAALLRQTGARYVIADSSIPLGGPNLLTPGSANFLPMITWAKEPADKYWEEFIGGTPDSAASPAGNVAFPLFYPAYYESMLARLYLFDGQSETPVGSTWVIQYDEVFDRGQRRKRLVKSQRFRTYEDAQRHVQQNPAPNQVIGGLDPMQSCIPLPKLDRYRLAYTSQPPPVPTGEPLRAVKIFEFTP